MGDAEIIVNLMSHMQGIKDHDKKIICVGEWRYSSIHS
jgi:hypothetical protein